MLNEFFQGELLLMLALSALQPSPDQGPAAAEIYDPATNRWATAAALHEDRFVHTATPLPDGRVLIAGGTNGQSFLDSAEIYDADVGTWSRCGNMSTERYGHTATLLASGEVLIAGGYNGTNRANCDIFNPATGDWRRAAQGNRTSIGYTV